MTLLDIIVKCRKRPHQRIIYRGDIYSRLQTGNRENAQQWESGGQSACPARGGGGGKVPCAPAAPGLAQCFLPERPHPSLWQRPEARTARDTERPQRACRRQHWPPRPNSHFPKKRAALALRPCAQHPVQTVSSGSRPPRTSDRRPSPQLVPSPV